MFKETDVEQVIHLVEWYIQLLKLFEGLDALDFF